MEKLRDDANIDKAKAESVEPISSVSFNQVLELYAREKGEHFSPERPTLQQDGGQEIHPDLEGITFNFWTIHEPQEACAVNFSGSAPKAPWANALTGRVFASWNDAKTWLKNEAEKHSGTK